MSQIYLYSGPIHSGKTTRLAEWALHQTNIDGILAPMQKGKRYLKRIASGELRLLEPGLPKRNPVDVYTVGKFSFSKSVFQWAAKALQENLEQPLNWLVIDEIGFLELDGQGLEPAVKKALALSHSVGPKNILIIVRERLVEKIITHYNLQGRVKPFILPGTNVE